MQANRAQAHQRRIAKPGAALPPPTKKTPQPPTLHNVRMQKHQDLAVEQVNDAAPRRSPQSELRVGVIGAGMISRDQHLPAWAGHPGAKLVGVADVSEAALAYAGEQFDIERRVTDYRHLLDDPEIDVVDICAPSALHAEISVQALQAGKHVLCEKPMATSRAGAATILAAALASGKKLMIGQHMRFEPSVIALHNFLTETPMGRAYYARAQWLRRRRLPGKPAFADRRLSGGGALYDLGVHMLDLAWWLMGCPRPLTASGGVYDILAKSGQVGSEWGTWNHETIDVEDFSAGVLRFEGGGLLTLEASWLGFQPEDEFRCLQMYGEHLGFVWPENRIAGERDQKPWDVQLAEATGEKAHRAVVRAFADAVIEDREVPIPPEQSAMVVAMLEAIYVSAAHGHEEAVQDFDVC